MIKVYICGFLFAFFSLLFSKAQAIVTTINIQSHYPNKLDSLYLRGNLESCGLNWNEGVKMSLISNSNNIYTHEYNISCLSSNLEQLEVKVLINDKIWMIGSNHHINISLTTSSHIYPWFYTSSGSLSILENVYSSELDNMRNIIVYLPPSYYENTLKLHSNILVMHDGQNLFNPYTSAYGTAWMCQDTMNNQIIQGLADEVIIVGIYNTDDRTNEYTYVYDSSEKCGGKGDLYLDFIESTVLPLINETFRVSIQRESLGILGSSLGGLISCYAGYTRSNIYGKVGCMSSSFWWDNQDFEYNLLPSIVLQSTNLPEIYLDSGTSGSLGGEAQCAIYTKSVYDYSITQFDFTENVNIFRYVDIGGEHNEYYWGKRFYIPVQHLFPSSDV